MVLLFAFFSVNGFVSVLMQKIGIQPPVMGILGDVDHTWVLQWILGIWKSFGWSAIIYIAAITGIDSELYDAAKVDGANKIQSIFAYYNSRDHAYLCGNVPSCSK